MTNKLTPAQKAYNATAAGQVDMMYASVGMEITRGRINLSAPGDYGADPMGDGTFRMVPSGDIVDFAERNARLHKYQTSRR